MPGKTILVVDDDDDSREVVATVLADEGYHVETAASGKLALTALAAMPDGEPALVVLDVMMPEMSGLDVLRVLRSAGRLPKLRVIILSATPELAQGLGARQVMRKPFDVGTLLAFVRAHVADLPLRR